MTTRTYATVMTGLSFLGLVAMLVAMSAIENARSERDKRVIAESMNSQGLDIYGHVTDFALENQQYHANKDPTMKVTLRPLVL